MVREGHWELHRSRLRTRPRGRENSLETRADDANPFLMDLYVIFFFSERFYSLRIHSISPRIFKIKNSRERTWRWGLVLALHTATGVIGS
jgi:hypothetical protein